MMSYWEPMESWTLCKYTPFYEKGIKKTQTKPMETTTLSINNGGGDGLLVRRTGGRWHKFFYKFAWRHFQWSLLSVICKKKFLHLILLHHIFFVKILFIVHFIDARNDSTYVYYWHLVPPLCVIHLLQFWFFPPLGSHTSRHLYDRVSLGPRLVIVSY